LTAFEEKKIAEYKDCQILYWEDKEGIGYYDIWIYSHPLHIILSTENFENLKEVFKKVSKHHKRKKKRICNLKKENLNLGYVR